MAYLGDIGLTIYLRAGGRTMAARSNLTLPVQPTGNGPISPSAPFLATPFSVVNLNGPRGAQMDRWSRVDAGGFWYFYDLSPGVYFATEAGVSRQWRIDVAEDLTFTVTPITSSFPFNASSGYIG